MNNAELNQTGAQAGEIKRLREALKVAEANTSFAVEQALVGKDARISQLESEVAELRDLLARRPGPRE
jgi:uncharacterized protein YceH (UPF0502 family)